MVRGFLFWRSLYEVRGDGETVFSLQIVAFRSVETNVQRFHGRTRRSNPFAPSDCERRGTSGLPLFRHPGWGETQSAVRCVTVTVALREVLMGKGVGVWASLSATGLLKKPVLFQFSDQPGGMTKRLAKLGCYGRREMWSCGRTEGFAKIAQ